MKMIKKMSAVLMAICLSISCFSMVAYAADGRVSFTDPETQVGEMVEVKCVANSTVGNIANVEVKLSYDTEYLRFDSGDGVTDDGNGTLTCTGSGTSAEVTFVVTFQALKEGTTSVEISDVTASDAAGNVLNMDKGQSAVSIAEGDPSKIQDTSTTSSADDMQVEVNGTTYTLTDSFADADIPSGYTRTQISLDGQERQMVTNESSGIVLGYLRDADDVGDFFLYSEEDATFSPYEEVAISDTTSIVILDDASGAKLPDTYAEVKMTLNGNEFPVWQDTENTDYYVMYAINNNGETGYYQYDSIEGTYQRFIVPQVEETKEATSFMDKLQGLLGNFMPVILVIAGLCLLIILIIIIVLAVKLRHRNLELDDLYDEYGIDLDDEDENDEDDFEEPVSRKKASKAAKQEGPAVRKPAKKVQIEDEDDFEAFEPLDEEIFDNFEGYYDEADFDEIGFDGSDDFIDDTSDLLSSHPEKKKSHADIDDTFKMDIIDLD